MKTFIIILIAVIVLAAVFIIDTLRDAGEFKTIAPHFAGSIQKIEGLIGAEDITIHPRSGIAYISCDDRRALFSGQPKPGAIYALDLKREHPTPKNITPHLDFNFHPHGISLWLGNAGEPDRLFVINHRAPGDYVEIFEIADSALVHRESIAGSLLLSPNDLVAVGPRSFYATNDHGSRSEFGRLLEDYLRLPRANVVYFDGSRFSVAADGLRYANGINVSPDGFTLYVAATTDFGVHVYSRDPLSGLLTKISTITTKTAVDNIEIDGDGNLWVTAHPKLLTFVKHSKDARRRSPSQILKITPTGASYQIDEIFLDDGRWISGSSVGAVFKNKRLIGSVFEPHILLCEFQTQ